MAFAYPTTTDLTQVLTAAGVEASGYDLQGALDAASLEFERVTGWVPFGKDANDRTVFYNPPKLGTFGCVLELQRGLLSLTSLTMACNFDGTGGTALTQGTDFLLQRVDGYEGGTDNRPWTEIRFINSPVGYAARSLKVIGKFGFTDTIPADVKQAILNMAAASVVINFQGASGAIFREKQGPVEIQHDATAGRSTIDRWMNTAKRTTNLYRAPWR
jgi:hypothetical protein